MQAVGRDLQVVRGVRRAHIQHQYKGAGFFTFLAEYRCGGGDLVLPVFKGSVCRTIGPVTVGVGGGAADSRTVAVNNDFGICNGGTVNLQVAIVSCDTAGDHRRRWLVALGYADNSRSRWRGAGVIQAIIITTTIITGAAIIASAIIIVTGTAVVAVAIGRRAGTCTA